MPESITLALEFDLDQGWAFPQTEAQDKSAQQPAL